MAYLWVITVSSLLCLGLLGWVFFYLIRTSLHAEDSVRKDILPHQENKQDHTR